MSETTRRPMIAVGYAAQTAGSDGTTTLILENGRAISVSATAASALNSSRERAGLPAIPTVTRSEAQALLEQLANRNAHGDEDRGPRD